MKNNVLWNGVSVCHNDTFVLLMYFVHKGDMQRRQVIRQYVKQNMIVDGKKVSYVFVVASLLNETEVLNNLKEENLKYGDILISIHEDNYQLVPITVLDAFYWVREYCKTVVFVARIDGDVWIQLGNLLHYLQLIPQRRILTGRPNPCYSNNTIFYKGMLNIPFDYPRPFVFVSGGAYVVSRDVVPYINIGVQYLDVLLPISEDIIVTEILKRAGVTIYPYSFNYTFLIHYRPGISIPQNLLFLHNIKDFSLFREVYNNHTYDYISPHIQYVVCYCKKQTNSVTLHGPWL